MTFSMRVGWKLQRGCQLSSVDGNYSGDGRARWDGVGDLAWDQSQVIYWRQRQSCAALSSEVLPLTGAASRCQGVGWGGVEWGGCIQLVYVDKPVRWQLLQLLAHEVVQWWLDHVFKILGQSLTWCLQTLHVLCIHTLQPCLEPWTSVCLQMPETTFLELCSGARGFSISAGSICSQPALHISHFHLYLGAAYWEVGKDHTPLQVDYIQQHILRVQMRYTQD